MSVHGTGGRHRLVRPDARPATVTRSASVVGATVGAVLALAAPSGEGPSQDAAPVRHPDASRTADSPLQPVVLDPHAAAGTSVTGRALAATHHAAATALCTAAQECEDHLAA